MRFLSGGVVAALLMVLLVAAPAQATGYSWQDAVSPSNAVQEKSVTAFCPPGEKVVGMGGWIEPAGVPLIGIMPGNDQTSVTATGRAETGRAGSWAVRARATCAATEAVTVRMGLGTGAATASCGDELVYSSGYQVVRPTGTPYVRGVVPTSALDQVTVWASEAQELVAVALCGPEPVTALPYNARLTTTSTTAELGFAGKPSMLVDGGTWIFGGGALVKTPAAYLDGLGPGSGLNGVWARGSRLMKTARLAAAADEDEAEWDMDTYSICIGSWY